jgi:hypothetical protein
MKIDNFDLKNTTTSERCVLTFHLGIMTNIRAIPLVMETIKERILKYLNYPNNIGYNLIHENRSH